MSVEILEIIVRANVQEQGAAATASAGNAGADDNFQQQQIIEECVDQVLEILRRKEER